MGLPLKDRTAILVEGLELLSEHVATLRATVSDLLIRGDPRGAAILDTVAVEESAKVLVLLDFARAGTKNQRRLRRTVQHFYDHVARGIYAEVAMTRPADYREVKEIVETYRPSLYRDGPNGFEWVFRNPIEDRREGGIYVDLVRDSDSGLRWATPQSADDDPLWSASYVTELVVAMRRSGLFTAVGLAASAEAWHEVELVDNLHWQGVRTRNVEILTVLVDNELQHPDITAAELAQVVEQWSFPLFELDLRKREVSQKELDKEFRQGEAQFYYDMDGPLDW